MLIYDNVAFEENINNNYVALGSFDGLHLGHLSLIEKIKELSHENNGNSAVFTFKNHPRKVINPHNKTDLLITNKEKISLLEEEKVDLLAFKDFDEQIMKMQPECFIKWLCEWYNVKGIVVGFNFKFGYKNLGDVELLKRFSQEYNYELHVMAPYEFENKVVSSTRIREELLQGNVEDVACMLSRPYVLKGKVIDGKKLGRTIGFPTANLQINYEKVIPKKGVYYTNVKINEKILKGITSVGNNPTVNGQELTVETYILDFDENIYGKNLEVYFISKIRNEIKFNNINELVQQLNKDKSYALKNKIILCQV